MKWSDRTIMWCFIGFQAIFGLLTLHKFPICLDEPYSIFYAQQSMPSMMQEVLSGNNAPLHFVLLNGWISLFGTSVWAVRSLSLIISLISVGLLFRLSRKMMSRQFAALAVGLFIFSRLNHFVALEARMYGLFTLFFILLLYSLHQFFVEGKRNYFWIALWNAGLFYSHYLGVVILLMEVGFLVIMIPKMDPLKWKRVFLSIGWTILLLIPGIYWFTERAVAFSAEGTWVAPAKWSDLVVNLIKLFNNQVTFWVTLLLVLAMLFIRQKKCDNTKKFDWNFLLYWSVGTYLILFLISVTFSSVFFIKYLQFLTVPFYLMVAFILDRQTREKNGWMRWAPMALIIPFIFSVKFVPEVNRETDQLVEYVQSIKKPKTQVFYCPPHYDLTLAYHLDKKIFQSYNQTKTLLKNGGFDAIYHARDMELNRQNVIYIDFDADFLYPDNDILNRLDEEMNYIESQSFKGDFNVYLYHP